MLLKDGAEGAAGLESRRCKKLVSELIMLSMIPVNVSFYAVKVLC